jgi:hypothetical protein
VWARLQFVQRRGMSVASVIDGVFFLAST